MAALAQFLTTLRERGASGFFAGVTDHIADYLKANPNWAHMDTVSLARKLVGLEIAAHPDEVGPRSPSSPWTVRENSSGSIREFVEFNLSRNRRIRRTVFPARLARSMHGFSRPRLLSVV